MFPFFSLGVYPFSTQTKSRKLKDPNRTKNDSFRIGPKREQVVRTQKKFWICKNEREKLRKLDESEREYLSRIESRNKPPKFRDFQDFLRKLWDGFYRNFKGDYLKKIITTVWSWNFISSLFRKITFMYICTNICKLWKNIKQIRTDLFNFSIKCFVLDVCNFLASKVGLSQFISSNKPTFLIFVQDK